MIDFVKTTEFHEVKSQSYLEDGEAPERILFQDYHPERLKSALSTYSIAHFEAHIKDLQQRGDAFISITFAVVAILFATVALCFGKPEIPV